MKCEQFQKELNILLDDRGEALPGLAAEHVRRCKNCRSLYESALSLRKLAQTTPQAKLSARSKNALLSRIAERTQLSQPSRALVPSLDFSGFLRGLRWERILLISGLSTACVALGLRLSEPTKQETQRLASEAEIQELLDEHAMAMDSGIFQSSSPYANIVTVSKDK